MVTLFDKYNYFKFRTLSGIDITQANIYEIANLTNLEEL